jgi:hypothetical protein
MSPSVSAFLARRSLIICPTLLTNESWDFRPPSAIGCVLFQALG